MPHLWALLLATAARFALAYEGAEYSLTFESSWGDASYPLNFPAGAYFAPLVGATLGTQSKSWQVGALASNGLRLLAETDLTTEYTRELASLSDFSSLVCGPQMRPSPGQLSLRFLVSREKPVLVLASGMRPSPDWFVGTPGATLWDGSNWQNLTISSPVYSAGTDRGTSYEAQDDPRIPESPVGVLQDTETDLNGPSTRPVQFRLTLQRTISEDGPFPSIVECEPHHGAENRCSWFTAFEDCSDAVAAIIGIVVGTAVVLYVVVQLYFGATCPKLF